MRSKLGGDFESVAVALMMTPDEYDAYLLNKAIAVCLCIYTVKLIVFLIYQYVVEQMIELLTYKRKCFFEIATS